MEQKELNAISDLFKSEYDKLLKEINDKLTFAYENADKLLEENNRLKTELAKFKKQLTQSNKDWKKFCWDMKQDYKQQLAEKDKQLAISNKTNEILYELRNSLANRIKLSNNNLKSNIWLSIYDCNELNDYQAEAEEALKKLEEK